MTLHRRPSIYRYFILTGSMSRWFYPVFAIVAAWIVYSRVSGGSAQLTPYVLAILLPLAAGTGVLTAARAGKFDVLLGAGRSRADLWWHAWVVACAVPSLLTAMAFLISGVPDPIQTLWRFLCLASFTTGIAFTIGLIEMRYAAGVLWLVARLMFFVIAAATDRLIPITRHPETLPVTTMSMVVGLVPEVLLEKSTRWPYLIAAALLGAAALGFSYRWFKSVDFVGKPS